MNSKDWLFYKMNVHYILASAITSYVFVVIFNFVITTAVLYISISVHFQNYFNTKTPLDQW